MAFGGISPERWQRIDALLAAALERQAAERSAFLAEACADDPELLRHVERLLAHVDAADSVLGESIAEFAATVLGGLQAELDREELQSLPTNGRMGPYRILDEIGRGGMGTIYLAERADEQFDMRVALKLVKRGMDTDEVLRRFRYERQILARLEHPNIARLYDGGATEDGRPYLVMEYIQGQPVTDYCDTLRLPLSDRLRLFETICGAVQFAHQNLVIHRDIKPSNILVTADGEVKLLDFGIAKLLDPSTPDTTPRTRTELRLLTPEYAAPEQFEGGPVTTASDVYTLGIVLYQLLTGRLPLERRTRRAPERASAQRDVERPSSVVQRPLPLMPGREAALSAEEIAARRGTTPPRLCRQLRGDLDTVVLKALADSPDRRYQSAEQLLADVRRHLRGEPVLARGDSAAYRAAKFVRRHRVVVSFTAALGILLASFAVTMAVQTQRISRAYAVAEARQGQAEELIGFMLGDLRGKLIPIGRLDVLNDVGTAALAYFAAVPEEELSDQELFRRSEALRLLGQVQLDQGNSDAALQTFRESLSLAEHLARRDTNNGEWQLGLGASHFWIGNIRFLAKNPDGALEHWRTYLEIAKRMAEQQPDSALYWLERSYGHGNVGTALEAKGDLVGARAAFEQALEDKLWLVKIDPDDLEYQSALATAYNKVGHVQRKMGDLQGALRSHRAELTVREAVAQRDTGNAQSRWLLALSQSFLGELLASVGSADESLERRFAALRHLEELVRRDSTNATWRRGLALSERLAGIGLVEHGRTAEGTRRLHSSHRLLQDLVAVQPASVDFRQELAKTEVALATAHRLGGRPDNAKVAAQRALATLEPMWAERPDHPESRRVASHALLEVGLAEARLGSPRRARVAWQRARETIEPIAQASGSTDHLAAHGLALLHLDQLDEARPIVETLLERGYRRADFLALVREKKLVPEPRP
jgi:eukaryotic-like serine/threonine-protein kinase